MIRVDCILARGRGKWLNQAAVISNPRPLPHHPLMSLKLKSTEQRVGCFLIKLEGRLDTTTHQQLSSMLDMIFGVPVRAITLDFAGLDYMSSMGLRVLMQLMKRLAAQNGSLLMIHAKDSIKAVLEMANVLPSMSLFASVEEADAYLDTLQKNA